jgi:DNA-binding NtrC family response regulator
VLAAHDWPGNVRQLENEVRKLVALGSETVGPEQLSPELLGSLGASQAVARATETTVESVAAALLRLVAEGRALDEAVDLLEREVLGQVLAATGGNRSETARRLGLSRPGLRKKMKRLKVEE